MAIKLAIFYQVLVMPCLFGIFATHSMDHIPARYAFLFSYLHFRSHHYYALWEIKTHLFKHKVFFICHFSPQSLKDMHMKRRTTMFSSEKIYQFKATQCIFICSNYGKCIHRGNTMHERILKIIKSTKSFFFFCSGSQKVKVYN